MEQFARLVITHADSIAIAILFLGVLESLNSTRHERSVRMIRRAAGYCANPTSRGGHCRNRPAPYGGRCGANHPDVLMLPRYDLGTIGVLTVMALLVAAVRPLARYVVPLLPPEYR